MIDHIQALAPNDAVVFLHQDYLIVQKWNWDYKECLAFQLAAMELVQKNRKTKLLVICSHPHTFTLGRGNERGDDSLVPYDNSVALKYPVIPINRGGGITFHYPGQFIIYPIIALTPVTSLDSVMCFALKLIKSSLERCYGVEGLLAPKKLMGVWHEKKKLASIGVGVERLVTHHGIALNLFQDEAMFNEIRKINPCGMNPTVYNCVENIVDREVVREDFLDAVLGEILTNDI